MIRAIFIDIDGTLRNDRREITERTKTVIRKLTSHGIYIVLTTGRCTQDTLCIQRECGASSYLICSNGGEIYDGKDFLFCAPFPEEAARRLFSYAKKVGVQLDLNAGVIRYTNYPTEKENFVYLKEYRPVQPSQVVLWSPDLDKMRQVYQDFLEDDLLTITNYSRSIDEDIPLLGKNAFIDFVGKSKIPSKGEAVSQVLTHLGIDPSEALSIGDGLNDVSMFQVTGSSVAMENASDPVKKAATYVTMSNNQEGVALVLEKVLKKLKEEKAL